MRPSVVCFIPLAALFLAGCAVSSSGQSPSTPWTNGFWFWQGSDADAIWSGDPVDVLFIQVGTLPGADERTWSVWGELPEALPPARQNWIVFRYDELGVPHISTIPYLAEEVSELFDAARRRNLTIAGVQLDIDSPTGSLAQYAAYLSEVRRRLPPGCQLSITALLDWFRPGTDVAKVIEQVDEYVPQFYDIADSDSYRPKSIAAPIDAAKWGPIFNRYAKRFRIGISTFGRARSDSHRYLYRDLTPLDLALNPAFRLQHTRNPAGKLVLTYRATRATKIGFETYSAGDNMQFILATPNGVKAAVESARRMRGRVAGVVFFRWPSTNETLALQPDEVLLAAGAAEPAPQPNEVQTVSGQCAAVHCVDVYLQSSTPLSPNAATYRIRTSTPLEYFLPDENVPARMTGPSEIAVSLPPYCGRRSLYLGRAVSAGPAKFTVEVEP